MISCHTFNAAQTPRHISSLRLIIWISPYCLIVPPLSQPRPLSLPESLPTDILTFSTSFNCVYKSNDTSSLMSQDGRNDKRNTSRASCTAFSSLVVTSSVPFATGHGDFSPAVSSCLPHFCLSAVSTPTWKCKNGTPGISRRCTCSQQCPSMSRLLSLTSAGMRLPCSLIAREKKILRCHGRFTHGHPENTHLFA